MWFSSEQQIINYISAMLSHNIVPENYTLFILFTNGMKNLLHFLNFKLIIRGEFDKVAQGARTSYFFH